MFNNYSDAVIRSEMARLSHMSDTALYDEASSFLDLTHGAGYYSRESLIQMIMQQKHKIQVEV